MAKFATDIEEQIALLEARGMTIHDKEKILEEKRKKAKKEAMAERVVKKETVKKKRAEVKKEVEDTALSNMYNGNKGSKAIPEMKKEDVEKSGMVESSFKDLYKLNFILFFFAFFYYIIR